jgi:hypothetical protein
LAGTGIHWADLLKERQRRLQQVLNESLAPVVVEGPWWVRTLRALWRRLRRQEFQFVSNFIADIIGYLDPDAQAAVHGRLRESLDRLSADVGSLSGKRPLTIIAHSLGTVISSNYVWDQAKLRRQQGQDGFHPHLQFENFFTLGSPLALFSLRYGGPDAFQQPVSLESPRGRWLNISDADDPVGMPLKTLNDAYARAVFREVRVNSGAYLAAHNGYFNDATTMQTVSRKLALDWLYGNSRLTPERLQQLGAEYDQTLGL